MELKELVKECHQTAKDKGFWDKERNFGEMLMLVTSELGECLEAHRKNKTADLESFEYNTTIHDESKSLENFKKEFENKIKDSWEDEICDTFIRLFDMCGGLNIDIEKHIELKMQYNKTRERLHGKQY